jgi:phytoene dehydrogenase-like protein
MQYDVIIIGAGHNGLTCAAYLARAGRRVLVVERREVVGGCAVTEEVDPELAPGCRVSTASYIASMLRPTIIRELKLGSYGLKMVACDPGVQSAFEDGDVVGWWSDEKRMRDELGRVAPHDVERFVETEKELMRLAAWLQPFFLEAPPDVHARGLGKLSELWRLFRRFRGLGGDDVSGLMRFLTGSLGEFLDRRFESDKLKRLMGRRCRPAGLAGPCHRRDGRYHAGPAIGLRRPGCGYSHGCAGRAHQHRQWPRHGRHARVRRSVRREAGGLERGPEAHVPHARRRC